MPRRDPADYSEDTPLTLAEWLRQKEEEPPEFPLLDIDNLPFLDPPEEEDE